MGVREAADLAGKAEESLYLASRARSIRARTMYEDAARDFAYAAFLQSPGWFARVYPDHVPTLHAGGRA